MTLQTTLSITEARKKYLKLLMK